MKAPRITAKPPRISISMVNNAMKCGAGTPSACRIVANASEPLLSLARRPNLLNVFIREFIAYSFMSELLGRVTAIDWKNLSGDERCVVGTKPHDGVQPLIRSPAAPAFVAESTPLLFDRHQQLCTNLGASFGRKSG